MNREDIINIRQETRGDGETPWSDSIAFARAINLETLREVAYKLSELCYDDAAEVVRRMGGE